MAKVTIRDIIVNSCDGARLVNRNQPIPGNIFLSAYTMLQRRLDGYSNTHLLSFTQKELTFDLDKHTITFGKFVPKDSVTVIYIDDPISNYNANDYDNETFLFNKKERHGWKVQEVLINVKTFIDTGDTKNIFEVYPDVEVDDLHEIIECYVNNTNSEDRWIDLSYVSFADFYNRDYGCGVYTVNIKSDDEQTLKLKEPLTFQRMKIIYTAPFEFDADTELNIPRQYIALFTAALTYDLATAYPRLGDSTVAMLKQRLDELEENVRRSSSVNKFISRDPNGYIGMTYNEFKNGVWLM